jgi:hypothetical protein
VGSLRDCTWILGLTEYRVTGLDRQEDGALVIELERRGVHRYVCSGCSRRTRRARDAKVHLGRPAVGGASGHAALANAATRVPAVWHPHGACRLRRSPRAIDPTFRQRIGLDCQSMPTSHAAMRHAVRWGRHAGRAALDEVRRQEFFRAGSVMRKHGRGKRWLLLPRWRTVRGSKRAELQALFSANRRLFKAYVLREQLDRLWTYKTRTGVLSFLNGWIDALRWQRLSEIDRFRRISLQAHRRDRGLLRSSRPLRRRGVDQHHHQGP